MKAVLRDGERLKLLSAGKSAKTPTEVSDVSTPQYSTNKFRKE